MIRNESSSNKLFKHISTWAFVSLSYLFITFPLLAQQTTTDTTKQAFFAPSPTPNKARIISLSTASIGGYTATMLAMNQLWYQDYERSKFHFFNDNSGWLQIDKVGHAWTAYAEAVYALDLYRWAGVKEPHPTWIAAVMAFTFQNSIELFDGFSAQWGASPGDIWSNGAGAGLAVIQDIAWKEQRIQLKFSSHQKSYKNFDPIVQERSKALYGTGFGQRVLKDYNGQSYWLSGNIHAFINPHKHPHTRFPKWLNIAVGYSAENMFGAERNIWTDEMDTEYDYSHIPRYRQFLLSVDIDLTKIKTRSRFLNFLLKGFNVLKIPAPALEFNTQGKVKFHPIYF